MGIAERREKEKLQRIKRIQEAARKVFFKRGYDGTTIEAVAQKAEISKGTIYLYFKNKDELYTSLMMPVLENLGNQVRALELKLLNKLDCTCQDIIMGLYDTMNNAYKTNADGLRIIQAFQLNSYFSTMDEKFANRVHRKARENIEVYRRVLARGVELKVIKDVNLYILADIFWGLFLGMAQLEETKFKLSGKNHLEPTLEFSFKLISDAVDTGKNQ
jgi:AcrR family transcriptional regulator